MIWTVIGTGIALAGLLIGLIAWLRSDMKDLGKELGSLGNRVVAIEAEQARFVGSLERVAESVERVAESVERTEARLDDLGRNVHQVARELSELRGEVRGRLSVRDLPTAPDTGVPTGRVAPRTARGSQG